ncbi:hypothetical protein B0A52_09829 [Exophiala mesophila]|uniref:Beta-lactamase-related domain-containing protein n=1 Tax=Exophiala mesophila TaxID=212818 RepID=A0A438MQP3_EXOME|nr:hypothetical protein B0A52_09829 [Exophiala mesophila]
MASLKGKTDPRFKKVLDVLEANIGSGEELGASLVINIDGDVVVDVYGGYVDVDRSKPWDKDTIVNVWSSTKTVATLALLILHDRGLIDVNENVAKYWPEFAANGKESVKIRHLMSHTSGLSGWNRPFSTEDAYDLERSTNLLAEQAPWWEPGTASGYHAITMGHLIGEVVRRVTGKSLTQFVADDIAGPLNADFQIGAKQSDWPRITNVTPPPPFPFDLSTMDPESVIVKTFSAPALDANAANTEGWRKAEIGAANGHGNARSLARILSTVSLGGTVDGHRLLSSKTIDMIFQEQANNADLVLGQPIRFGIGYGIAGGGTEQTVPFLPKGQNRRVAFWGGWGGSINIMDVDKRVTISYVMNKMGAGTLGSERAAAYLKLIYDVLGDHSPNATAKLV